MTAKFKWLLSEGRLNQRTFAKRLGMGRSRLCQVLGNVPGRGGVRRKHVAAYIMKHFPNTRWAMLTELGWDEQGNLLGGTFHVEQRGKASTHTKTF